MSLNTIQNNTTASNLYKTSIVKNASEAKATTNNASVSNSTDASFGQTFAQAVSSVPSKTLSPEALDATVSSSTIQTSTYVFDPLGVVGQLPESNTFLQAIRAMLGKPLEVAAGETAKPVVATATTSAPISPVPTFGALPAATSAPVSASVVTQSAVSDAMSAIEAQLNYQTSPTTSATPTPSTPTPAAPTASATELVDQYIANSSASAVASMQSALVNTIDQEEQPS